MEWTRGQPLARGSTATVYLAHSPRSGQVFAVKSAELRNSEALQKEQRILSALNCPQIVSYQGCDVTHENGEQWYNLFMEYAPRGTLSDHGGPMEEALAVYYTRQILLGLNYLHSNGIVHCDVKGRNVLVTDGGAKIADFGCARRIGSGGGIIAGTPAFMAPEVARGEQQGFPADVWALGCTVLEMITGMPPWHGADDPVSVIYRVGFSGEAPEIPGFVSEQGREFLSRCLKWDPRERWTAEELLGHVFVAESRLKGKECEFALGRCDSSETPTSVLERGFWESTRGGSCSSWDSASGRDRVRRLCGGEHLSWEWDDDDDDEWVTVRTNDEHHKETEDFGSDNSVCILGEANHGLVIFDEPKVLIGDVIVELGRWDWNVIIDDCCCNLCSSDCGCCNSDSIVVFLGCSCLKIVVVIHHVKFDYWKKFFSIMRSSFFFFFLLSLFLFFNPTLDELDALQFQNGNG